MKQPSLLTHNQMIYKGKTGFDFPKFFEFYEKACSSTWTHHEVSMDSDLRDWQYNSSELERKVIAGVLRGFVASELGIGDYWSNDVCRIFAKPEIHAMARAFSFFECTHAAAYSYLNDVLGLNEYEEFIQDPIAVKKIETFFSTYGDKVKLAVFSGAGEAVSLFSSFAILLSFNRDGRFKGLAQIISWSSLDEACVHGDTEVLTPGGWKKISEYSDQDQIAQYDLVTKEISFVRPSKFIKSKSNQLIEIKKNKKFYQRITPDHTIVDFKKEKVRKTQASTWKPQQSSMPVSGYYKYAPDMTFIDQLTLALQNKRNKVQLDDSKAIFVFKDVRKIELLRNLLLALKKQKLINDFIQSNIADSTVFEVFYNDLSLKYLTKNLYDVYTPETAPKGFINELNFWFQEKYDNPLHYTNADRKNVDFVQTIAHLNGFRGYINHEYKLKLVGTLNIPTRHTEKSLELTLSKQDVYCFKVPTQAFLIRDLGLISVTGNCHANGGVELFNELVNEVGITEEEIQQIYTGFELIVNNEFSFIDNIFSKIKIPNLNPLDLKAYIKTRANTQLKALHLEPRFEMSLEEIKRSQELAQWFEPMAFGVSSNDVFAQNKDGSNYISKVSQDFESVNVASLGLNEFVQSIYETTTDG